VTDTMWAQAGFAFYHAHSAYLDHLVQAGVVSLVLVVAVVLLALRRSVRRLVASGDVLAMWPAGSLVCLLFYGIDEQSFASSFGWSLVVLAAALAAPDGVAPPEPSPRRGIRPSSRLTAPTAPTLRPQTQPAQPVVPAGRTAMEASDGR
jgi:O-antigen ligase